MRRARTRARATERCVAAEFFSFRALFFFLCDDVPPTREPAAAVVCRRALHVCVCVCVLVCVCVVPGARPPRQRGRGRLSARRGQSTAIRALIFPLFGGPAVGVALLPAPAQPSPSYYLIEKRNGLSLSPWPPPPKPPTHISTLPPKTHPHSLPIARSCAAPTRVFFVRFLFSAHVFPDAPRAAVWHRRPSFSAAAAAAVRAPPLFPLARRPDETPIRSGAAFVTTTHPHSTTNKPGWGPRGRAARRARLRGASGEAPVDAVLLLRQQQQRGDRVLSCCCGRKECCGGESMPALARSQHSVRRARWTTPRQTHQRVHHLLVLARASARAAPRRRAAAAATCSSKRHAL